MEPEAKGVDRDYMAGLGKGLAVIECFDNAHKRLTVAEAAERVGLSRAAARRCLLTLVRLGYAAFDGKFFRLTPRVMRLGYAYLSSTLMPQLVQPFLEQLSGQIQESSSASILDGDEIVYVARAATKRIMSIGLNVGTRLPAFCTSMGRVLLAALPPEDARARLAACDRRKWTPATITSVDALMAALAKVRAQGYSVIDQELETGLVSIATPILDDSGRTVAAINIGTQSARFPAAALPQRFLPRLREVQIAIRPLLRPAAAGPSASPPMATARHRAA